MDVELQELDDDGHPALTDMDTGTFRAVTNDFIAESAKVSSSPTVANFSESAALQGLTEVQQQVSARLKNILFLTAPPRFDDDE